MTKNHVLIMDTIDRTYLPRHPALFEQYLKVASAATQQGLTTFIHAEAKHLRAMRLFIEAATQQDAGPTFRSLRLIPEEGFFEEPELLKQRIFTCLENALFCNPEAAKRLDIMPYYRNRLVSTSYSLVQHAENDSANHYLFSGSHGGALGNAIENMSRSVLTKTLHALDYPTDQIERAYKQIQKLSDEYAAQPFGTPFLIAVPSTCFDAVYPSFPYGIPRHADMEKELKFPGPLYGNKQARVMICNRTLNPTSGIKIIDCSDTRAVEAFCKPFSFTVPHEMEEFRPYFLDAVQYEKDMERLKERQETDAKVKALGKCFSKPEIGYHCWQQRAMQDHSDLDYPFYDEIAPNFLL